MNQTLFGLRNCTNKILPHCITHSSTEQRLVLRTKIHIAILNGHDIQLFL